MSPIWKVEASEHSYDEYDAFIVRADSEERALEISAGHFEKYQIKAGLKIELVDPEGPEGDVLGSYNAG